MVSGVWRSSVSGEEFWFERRRCVMSRAVGTSGGEGRDGSWRGVGEWQERKMEWGIRSREEGLEPLVERGKMRFFQFGS